MTNKVTDIPFKFVIIERDHYGYVDPKLTTTPVSVEALLGHIYQLKPGATLHRIHVKNRAVTAKVLAGENAIVIKESSDTIEYVNKDDLEPYELSDYDKQRLAKYDNKQNKLNLFDNMIFSSIVDLIDTYRCVNICNNKNEIELFFDYTFTIDNDKATIIKTAKEIVSKIKNLGCHVVYHNHWNDFATIHTLKTVDNLQKLPE